MKIASILVLFCATSLSAQSPAHSTITTARAGNWYVRLGTSSGDSVEGRIALLRGDTVRVARTPVLLSDVATIDRRVRRGGGALPTGLFGAAVFGAIGLGLSGLCEFDCEYAWVLPTAGGAAIGMTMGTVVGAMVAPGRIEWRRVHPTSDTARVAGTAPAVDEQPYAGGGVTFSAGTGWSLEERTYRILRLGLQLGGTSRAERPVETTGEFQLIAAPDGSGVVLFAGGGANLMLPSGAYGGAAVGFVFGGEPMPSVGARAGLRPRRAGLRPELRADYIFGDAQALLMTLSIGLEVH